MATELKPGTSRDAAQAAAIERSKKVKQYVDQQLEKTRKQVKAFDLAACLLGLVALVVAFFLLAAVLDAWVWPFGTVGRFICLGLLLIGFAGYSIRFIFPLILRRINPNFAARMIEESTPTFKNSLMNYLAIRKEPESIRRAVYDAVARQAAQNLSEVPEDATVDRSNLINTGFILVAICVAAVGYLILSPKNPLQTVVRILSPAAKIAKPSIVKIVDVLPGDSNVFFGEHLDVSAAIRGRYDTLDVNIVFSTANGQLVDQVIPMVANESSDRYEAKLSTDAGGIQQSLIYRIEAGDGISPDFQVTVRPNPTISVQSAILRPPAYTKLPPRVIEGQGDIQALEGTRIRIAAIANLPIKVAYIELVNERRNDDGADDYQIVKTVEMNSEEAAANGEFVAHLNNKRDAQLFTHYRIRFVSTEGDRNESPNVYPVRIAPDLAPEVVIVNPLKKEIALPINQTLAVDIQANDLDFEISSVDVHLDHKGTRLLDRDLHLTTQPGSQRVSARQIIDPQALLFKVGDRAIFYATAADNRASSYSDEPDPNVSRTENYTLVITEPQEQVVEPEQQNPPEQQPPQPEQQQDQQNQGEQGSEKNQQSQDGDEGADAQSGTQSGAESAAETGAADDEEKQGQADSKSEGNEGQQGKSGKGDQGERSQQSDPDQQQSGKSSGDSADQGTDAAEGATEEGTGQQSKGQNQTGKGQQSDGQSQSSGEGQIEQDGERGSAGDNMDSNRDGSLANGDQQPLPKNASEGDQIEQLQKLLKEQEKQQSGQPDNQDQQGKNDTDSQQQGQPDQQQNQQGQASQQQGQNPQHGQPAQEQPAQEDQQGKDQQGKDQQGKDQQGKDQQGKDQQGKDQQGKDQQGKDQQGKDQQGKDQQGKDQQGKGQQGEGQQGEDQQTEDQQGKDQQGKDQQGKDQQGKDQQGKDQQGKGQQGEGQQGEDQQTEDQQGKDQQGNDQQGKDQQGKDQQGKDQQGEGQQGESQQGESQQGESQQGEGQQGEGQQGEGQQGEGQQGEGQQGEGQQGEGQQGEGQQGEGQQGEGQQGEGQQGEGQQGAEGANDAKGSAQLPASGMAGGSGASGGQDLGDAQANLEYAKKATDMVLDQLEEQAENPDSKLLDQMNWTREDLQNFMQRWKEMKLKAESGNAADKERYETALQRLGLIPQSQTSRKVAGERDDLHGLSEDGAVNQPPAHLIERFNAFQKERNRANNN